MSRSPIDDDTAERLLSGRVSPEDAPPGFAGLAGMVRAAAAPAAPAELARELDVVTAAVAAVRSVPSTRLSFRRRTPMLTKLLPAKVAAVAATITIGVATAAAATGNLPNAAQTAASGALSHIGISIPKPNSHAAISSSLTGSSQFGASYLQASASGGPSANADFGQCTAFLAGNGKASTRTNSPAFKDLIADHGGTAQSTSLYCKGVLAAKGTGHSHSDGSASASGSMQSTAPNGLGSGQGSAGGQGGASGGSASGSGRVEPGTPPTLPTPPKPPTIPNPVSADYGRCTAFLDGQKASAGAPGGATAPSPKDTAAAMADLIAKHGGSVQSATIYCNGVVATPPSR